MGKPLKIDLFVEDQAHEKFLKAILERLAKEQNRKISIDFRQARGGHGRALTEFEFYQKNLQKGNCGLSLPDVVIVGIDANCKSYNVARQEIQGKIIPELKERTAIACPDPHIEVWYLADLKAIEGVIGIRPKMGQKKCQRDKYKSILKKAIKDAGFPATLGGIEFAEEIVLKMNIFDAGKQEAGFKHFIDELTAFLKKENF